MKHLRFKSEKELQDFLSHNRARAITATTGSPGVASAGTPEPGPPALPKEKMNKWEAAYAYNLDLQKLAGLIKDWRFEPWKFILAPGVTYRPDFLVIMPDGTMQIHEVKGFLREDARVKLLTTAERYPFFRFFKVKKEGDGWHMEEVGRR